MLQIARTYAVENVSRRNLLKGVAFGGGLVLMARLLPASARADSMHEQPYATGATGMPHGTVNDPHVFVSVAPDGTVTIVAARAEMGTGAARTSLPMIVAEEMDADWDRVKIMQSAGDEERYGNQDTDGSRSTRHFLQPMRECGAAARLMLEMAAAQRWSVDLSEVEARHHEVMNKSTGARLGYGELAEAAAALPMPAAGRLTFKQPAQYRYIGTGRVQIVDLFDITVGKAGYGADHRIPGQVVRDQGNADAALKSAAQVLTAEYYIPHLAHTPMERPAALVNVSDGRCEAWAPVQSPGGTRVDLAKLLKLPPDKVALHTTLLGGGFGRKSKCDYVLEAALLSKELGKPVQVQWTREDDVRNGFCHAVALERIEAAVDANRKVVAWRHRSASPTIISTFAAGADHQAAFEVGMGLVDVPFDIANIRCETGAAAAHTRIGWFRSVYNIPHGFAVQSFVTELAHLLGRDPKDMLLELIGPARIVDPRPTVAKDMFWDYGEPWDSYPIETGRLRHVAELAAEQAGWGRTLPPGRGMGIAAHRSFVSYVATVVEVEIAKDGTISVPRVDTAIDCGFHVNPERIASQVEGAAIMGLTLAKNGEITFKEGRVQQSNFHDYQMVRTIDAPALTKVHIVEHPYSVHAGGVGEPPLPPFAPALCNAIFAATGKRIRSLPIGTQLKT